MGLKGPIIGRGHAHFFFGRKEIGVFHLGLGDFWDLVSNKPVVASTPNKPVEAKNFKILISFSVSFFELTHQHLRSSCKTLKLR